MRFLLSPMGSAGDVHPFVGLGLALRSRGHDVEILTSSYFRELIERHDLTFVELGTSEEFLEAAAHPDLWHPFRSFGHIVRSGIEPVMRRQFAAFVERYEPGKTVAVVNIFGWGGLLAQEKTGLPVASLHLQPAVIWSSREPPHFAGQFGPNWLRTWQFRLGQRFVLDRTALPPLNAFRAELDLDPVKGIMQWWHSPWLTGCLFPEWYASPQTDWPQPLAQTDFPLWDDGSEEELSSEVAHFLSRGKPPIAFTPGSANRFGRRFFDAARDACHRLGKRAIFLTRFQEQVGDNLPDDILWAEYVPLAKLLPHCEAAVHHGGIGTLSQGFRAGIPQVVMTLAHDQFDNAARLRRLGAGDAMRPRHFRGPYLARVLDRLLSDPQAVARARQLAERIETRRGLENMAERLEQRAEQGC